MTKEETDLHEQIMCMVLYEDFIEWLKKREEAPDAA